METELSLLNLFARDSVRSRKGGARQQQHVPIEIETLEGNEYPVLPLRDTVVFPSLVSPLFIGRDRSIRAVEAAEAMNVPLLVVAQHDPEVRDPCLLYTSPSPRD